MEKTALYRHFDQHSVLLYVGISCNVGGRSKTHVKTAVWSTFVSHSSITWYAKREDAQAAERAAITSEHPVFNIKLSRTERYQRVSAYLDKNPTDQHARLRQMIASAKKHKVEINLDFYEEEIQSAKPVIPKIVDQPVVHPIEGLIGLRDAYFDGVVELSESFSYFRALSSKDPSFPTVVSYIGSGKTARKLYKVSDLQAWDRNRSSRKVDA